MTTAIEVTKREMYRLKKDMLNDPYYDAFGSKHYRLSDKEFKWFEASLEAHLEELRKALVAVNESTVACARQSSAEFQELERRCETQAQSIKTLQHNCMALKGERDTQRNRVQVLEMANATSGEVIRGLKDEMAKARRARMKARLHEYMASASTPAENVASAPLDAKTGAILSAVVDCQRIVTSWILQEIKAKSAMYLISDAVHAPAVKKALHAFEKPEQYMEIVLHAQYDDGVRTTRSLHPISGCMHSFHPAFPSGELCTFCGVGK